MKRYRWFRAEWPMGMRALAKRLKSKAFDEDSADGFVLDRVRDDCIEGRFIERFEYDDIITDPFGKELTFHRVDYNQCEFRTFDASPGLELVDAPRSVQAMVSRMLEATDFALAISPLSVNVLDWADTFQRAAKVSGLVDSMQLGALELASGISAKAVIRGDTDVREVGATLIEGRRHTLEKLQLRLPGLQRTKVVLTNVGSVKLESEVADELLPALRASLTSVLSKEH
ncbi:hypothetical protein [Variovorax sp. KK3]|uniref:hypothetical protein n=1 Tax=Variovorax sp. KK3 TaxID=1855728 RepID=UPI00097C1368|nr:hypothetical protein [Variovorax sp. KK3]